MSFEREIRKRKRKRELDFERERSLEKEKEEKRKRDKENEAKRKEQRRVEFERETIEAIQVNAEVEYLANLLRKVGELYSDDPEVSIRYILKEESPYGGTIQICEIILDSPSITIHIIKEGLIHKPHHGNSFKNTRDLYTFEVDNHGYVDADSSTWPIVEPNGFVIFCGRKLSKIGAKSRGLASFFTGDTHLQRYCFEKKVSTNDIGWKKQVEQALMDIVSGK